MIVRMSLEEAVRQQWKSGLFGGCAVGGATAQELSTPLLVGTVDGKNPLSETSLFDAASLTKSVATATLALIALQEKRTELSEPIIERLPELQTAYREEVTLLHLLTHTLDYRISTASLKELPPQKILDTLFGWPFQHPPGASYLYCNATSILLGLWLEQLWEGRLEVVAQKRIFGPLQMNHTTFAPIAADKLAQTLPSEVDRWRAKEVRGEVHDESAWALRPRGVVGSAGLFTTIGDLQRYSSELLRAARGEGAVLERATIELANHNWLSHLGEQGALGFERNQSGWMGDAVSTQTIGKTGFTGCSLVVDFEKERALSILSNSSWPRRKPRPKIDRFRAELANLYFAD